MSFGESTTYGAEPSSRRSGYSFETVGAAAPSHRDPSQERTRSYMRVSRDPTPEVEALTSSIP